MEELRSFAGEAVPLKGLGEQWKEWRQIYKKRREQAALANALRTERSKLVNRIAIDDADIAARQQEHESPPTSRNPSKFRTELK